MGRGWGWIKGRRDRSDLGCDQSNPRYDCSNPGYDCLNPRYDRLNPGCDVLNPGCDSIERGDDVFTRGFAGRTNRKITNDTADLPAPSMKKAFAGGKSPSLEGLTPVRARWRRMMRRREPSQRKD